MSDQPPLTPRARSHAIDALRGAAIVSMFAANLAGPCLTAPHPFWLRAYGSFAAPAFVLLAGMMTSLGARPAPLRRLLERSLLLLGLAVAIDVLCWGIAPFETFDVLYLLALALPLAGLCSRLGLGTHALLGAGLLLLAPWLRDRLGYGPLLPEQPWPVWRRAIVDGWFPIFPWLGVALLGSLLGRLKPLSPDRRHWLFRMGLALSLAGGLGWWLAPPTILIRKGYSELFYPPSLQFLALALGAVLLALAAFDALERHVSLSWLASLGRASLFSYVAHIAVIAWLLDESFERLTLPAYLALYAVMTLGLTLVAAAKSRLIRSVRAR